MYSLLALCMMFLTVASMKFCKNCKNFIPNINSKNGKCRILPMNLKNYLVTGNSDDIEYYYCTTAREYDDMCGKNASKYE